ncbi:GIN domain-containing protein [Pedobacter sp. L105]|uniref:GIN domain-containing protein n=1 Tax=Pedobacter sp. L105 TaxID=1641871 RepID=UPI00131EB365|nr:DUF2807 domain-containing protein [Pedobacter sp. L105]
MKNSLKTKLHLALTAIMLMGSVLTAAAALSKEVTVGAPNLPIRRITVTGNTKVIVIQSSTDWVMMDDDDIDKVSLKQAGDELRISSTEKTPVTVTVHVREIFRITAANTASIRTLGKLKMRYLQLILKDEAVAMIKTTTESLYSVINDHASLELLGSTQTHILRANRLAKLKTDKFAAVVTQPDSSGTEDLAMNSGLKPKK